MKKQAVVRSYDGGTLNKKRNALLRHRTTLMYFKNYVEGKQPDTKESRRNIFLCTLDSVGLMHVSWAQCPLCDNVDKIPYMKGLSGRPGGKSGFDQSVLFSYSFVFLPLVTTD